MRAKSYEQMAATQIEDRKLRGTKHRDILSRFLKEHERKPESFTEKDVHTTCAMNMYVTTSQFSLDEQALNLLQWCWI